jgi:multicomponent Na+:H+ antiporter subunit F
MTAAMPYFLLSVSGFILMMVAVGLIRILRGPTNADRMMATQLFGTGGIAALLLFSAAADLSAVADVALVLALLAAFASVAFVKNASPETDDL